MLQESSADFPRSSFLSFFTGATFLRFFPESFCQQLFSYPAAADNPFSYLLVDFHNLCGIHSCFQHFINLFCQMLLRTADSLQIRLCHRMLCHKDRTAVLKRLDRCLISIDLLWKSSMISCLSKPISGRNTGIVQTSLVAARLCIGLARHLPDTLTGDQVPGHPVSFAKCSAILHHIPTHNDGQLVVRTLIVDIQLNIGKVDDMQIASVRL